VRALPCVYSPFFPTDTDVLTWLATADVIEQDKIDAHIVVEVQAKIEAAIKAAITACGQIKVQAGVVLGLVECLSVATELAVIIQVRRQCPSHSTVRAC
jgi:hypothetical protein